MDPLTKDALKVYGKDRKTWEPIVRQQIDPSILPRRYGGYMD